MERVTGIGGVFFARATRRTCAPGIAITSASMWRPHGAAAHSSGASRVPRVDERIEDGPDGRFGWAADPRGTGSSSGNRPRGG